MMCFPQCSELWVLQWTLGAGGRGTGAVEGGRGQGTGLVFFVKEEYNQRFVFRMLCNILEWDIGVFRDLV